MRRIIIISMALFLFSCHHRHSTKEATPTLPIVIAEATADSIVMRYSFVTHLQSNYDALIQPRVSGYLLQSRFSSGMPVKRGELLFVIDANLLNTSLYAAKAQLASAQAQLIEAKNNYERALPLSEINAISRTQMDQYTAAYASARSAVESARQSVESARLQSGYANIYSPINGIIAHSKAHKGDYVGPGTEYSTLTTISNLDTLSAHIAIPTSLYMRYAKRGDASYDNRGLLSDIKLYLSDGTLYDYSGIYDYTAQSISPTSGTITLVVDFPNPQQRLKAGEFARIETGIGSRRAIVTIPQQAVMRTQGISSVWVVKADNTVEYRHITTAETLRERWIVTEGLDAGERVAVTGLQKLHNGDKVSPQKSE